VSELRKTLNGLICVSLLIYLDYLATVHVTMPALPKGDPIRESVGASMVFTILVGLAIVFMAALVFAVSYVIGQWLEVTSE